jgi:hypothetical protein
MWRACGRPYAYGRENQLADPAAEGYGRRMSCCMVMVRRVRRHRDVSPGLGMAPAR